jgi:hypothetical protein
MMPGGGHRTTGMGQTKEGSGGGPITYPTDVPFGSKKRGTWYKFYGRMQMTGK